MWGTQRNNGVYGSGAVIGVGGDSTTGTGMSASSLDGTALNVDGKAVFSRSGAATVAWMVTEGRSRTAGEGRAGL